MTSTRRTASIVGVLFLVQTLAFVFAEQVLTGVLKRPDYLAGLSGDADVLTIGALLAFASGVAVVGIAILMFPLLKPTSEPLALGYVGERVIELVLQVLFYLSAPLLMIAISHGLRDGSLDASTGQAVGPVLKALHDVGIVVLYLVTSVGGTIFAFLLLRSRLVPRPLAILGLIGYPVLLVGCVLAMFGATDLTQGSGLLAVLPGGLFELILPILLIVKGFSHRAVTERGGAFRPAVNPA
jgi:Domain of unknown function (DUF4386)